MTKGVFIRSITGLVPDDDNAREALLGVAPGTLVACEVSRPRNLKLLRLYWKMASTVGDAVGVHRDAVSDVVKLRTGHFRTVKTASGIHYFPKSIAFSKMHEGEFRKFFDEACTIVCREFIPHMNPGALRDDIMRMVGVPVEDQAA